MKWSMVLVLTVSVGPNGWAGGAEVKAPLEQLQGVWKLVKLEREGANGQDAFLPEARVVVEGKVLRFRVGEKTLQTIRITLDSGKTPAAINLTAADGPAKGKTARGIYRLAGKRLTLCWPLVDDQPRPRNFGKAEDKDVATLQLVRE